MFLGVYNDKSNLFIYIARKSGRDRQHPDMVLKNVLTYMSFLSIKSDFQVNKRKIVNKCSAKGHCKNTDQPEGI